MFSFRYFLRHLCAEGREVVGFAAGDEALVGHDF